MSNPLDLSKKPDKEVYTDEQINELAEWLQDLTLKQAFFLKESYEGYLNEMALSCGETRHVH